ncbi:MAG: hypothetical protein ACREPG_01830 [Candidatus Binatia bacterium]
MGDLMAEFLVKCFNGGIWDRSPEKTIQAPDEKSAAEKVCGRSNLRTAGKPGELCAQVRIKKWPLSQSPDFTFYLDQNSN